jgi:hypothetical protein
MSPTEAALALVDSNRSSSHRAEYKLALAVGGDESPPEEGSVSIDSHTGCVGVFTWNCDLHFKKGRSFLAVAATGSIMRATGGESAHEVRMIPLEYDEARRIAGMIWALTRIRSFPSSSAVRDEGIRSFSSTADGHVELKIEPQRGGAERVTAGGTCFAFDTIHSRWHGRYEPEICANFARQLLRNSLSEYLGERWTTLDPPSSHWEDPDSQEGREILHKQIGSVFNEWKARKDIDADLLAGVVRAAGDSAFTDFLEVLKEIESSIPEVSKAEQRFAEAKRKGGYGREWSEAFNAVKGEAGYILRYTVKDAIKHLEMIGDGDALTQMASSGLYDSDWALKQLKKISPDRWAETMAAIILRMDKAKERPWESAAKFELLVRNNPDIAQTTAAQMEGRSQVLHLLDTSSAEEILEVVRDEKNKPEVRTRALEVFCRRWPELEDQALKSALAMIQFPDAAAVLARCENPGQYWETIVAAMNASDSGFDMAKYLSILGEIAKVEEPFRGKLWQILKPMLRNSQIAMNDVFSLIYDLDFREAAPELRRLATTSPDDIEKSMDFYSSKVTPVEGRFHLPRQILTAWRTDISPALRAKLLISWRLNLGARDRLTDELSGVLELLDSKGAGEVLEFVNWAGEASAWSESGKAFLDELSVQLENVRVED